MRTLSYALPILAIFAFFVGCSNMNGCSGSSSNNNAGVCNPGTHSQPIQGGGGATECVPG